jgi:acyl carrier protein
MLVGFATESPSRESYDEWVATMVAAAAARPCVAKSTRHLRLRVGSIMDTEPFAATSVSTHVGENAWERAMGDVATEVRDILVFHLGADERRLTDEARLTEDLGADSLDVVEIVMSCEERFAIAIPNRIATRLTTVGEAVRFIESEMAVR